MATKARTQFVKEMEKHGLWGDIHEEYSLQSAETTLREFLLIDDKKGIYPFTIARHNPKEIAGQRTTEILVCDNNSLLFIEKNGRKILDKFTIHSFGKLTISIDPTTKNTRLYWFDLLDCNLCSKDFSHISFSDLKHLFDVAKLEYSLD